MIDFAAIMSFVFLFLVLTFRVFTDTDLNWLNCGAGMIVGYIAADVISGFVHWVADRYGSKDMMFFGPRFIKPFREHHSNPTDIVEHGFVTVNGNTCLVMIPVVLGVLVLVDSMFFSAFWWTLFMCIMLTNQIHKWAHMDEPPVVVGWLQNRGLILTKENHDVHHVSPYDTFYCITTGWFNKFFDRIRLFDRIERVLSKIGIKPSQEV
jgi:ubiquitin-conjugating enzyme E2 variant